MINWEWLLAAFFVGIGGAFCAIWWIIKPYNIVGNYNRGSRIGAKLECSAIYRTLLYHSFHPSNQHKRAFSDWSLEDAIDWLETRIKSWSKV